MAVVNTTVNNMIWMPHDFSCCIVDESPDSTKPKKGYVWKKNDQIIATSASPTFTLDSVKEDDVTGWSVNVRGYALGDTSFSGDSIDIGTENFTFKLFDNPYVEHVYPPTSFNIGDELKAKIVFRSNIPANISVDLYYNNGLVDSVDGDLGLDHREFKIAKFAWPEFSGLYRMELSDETGDVKFVYPFTATIRENLAVFNVQKYAPAYYTVEDDAPNDAEHTIVRYRLERGDGTLVYESKNKTLYVTKHATEADAGDYVACIRSYKVENGPGSSESYLDGQRHRFRVNVKENEFFSRDFSAIEFRYPSGSSVSIDMPVSPVDNSWNRHYGLLTNNVYFTWMLGGTQLQSKKYGDPGYDRISLEKLQYDNSVALQLLVAPARDDDPQRTPTSRPLFYDRRMLDIYDVEHDYSGIEVGEPIVIKIVDPEPPASNDPTQTRSLAILKNDVLVTELPIETKEYKITDAADKEHNGIWSHEYRDSPSRDPHSAHTGYDIAGRATYKVEVIPNMEFDGPHPVQITEGDPLVLEATMIKPPSNYVPTYEFSKSGIKLPIADSSVPVYRKANATLNDSGVYKFVAFADKNNNTNLDEGEIVGYTKYVQVVVNKRPDIPDQPRPEVKIVTMFSDFSKGKFSPCPYWVIDELVELMEDPHGWMGSLADAVYYDWQITIFNEFLKGKDLYLQDSCNGYWAIVRQRDMSIETGYGRFKHYPGRNP
ncbi:hypothetical protein JK32_00086 [Shigella phage JK32]|nr:hypothetical protein JK32_00086 [Shigella phage JK32]